MNDADFGHVHDFKKNSKKDGEEWIQLGNTIVGKATNDYCRNAVALSSDGSIPCVGALLNDNANVAESGLVRLFKFNEEDDNGAIWTKLGIDLDGTSSGDQSGYSTALSTDGSIVAIGSPRNDFNGEDAGQVSVFQMSCASNIDCSSECVADGLN